MSVNKMPSRRAAVRPAWFRALGTVLLICLITWGLVLPEMGPRASADMLDVVINRVMTSNPSACYSLRGEYYDWLELLNISDDIVHLEGWKLTDKGDLREAFTFGDVSLMPGQTLIVYCDDAPEGFDGTEIFTGFRLSADGETLLLADRSQHLQSLQVPAMGKRDVYQRDPATGTYSALSFAEALGMDEAYTASMNPPYNPSGVTISEIMAVNHSTLTDEDGDYSDWVEIYNGSTQPVSLEGCSLSDDDTDRRKWIFPDVTIGGGEYLLVFCSGKDRTDPDEQLHTNFKLSKDGEALRLYNPVSDAISYVRYESAVADVSFSRLADGSMTALMDPSPGQPNTALGVRNATEETATNDLGLYINEVFATGKGADWVEIHNTSGETADLSNMGLSDSTKKPRKWQFPKGASIEPDGYVLVRLVGGKKNGSEDGDEAQQEEASEEEAQQDDAIPDIKIPAPEGSENKYQVIAANYTADFGLSEGETLSLTATDGQLLDRVKLYDQVAGVSFGRAEGYDDFRYFGQVTPGAHNAAQSYGKAAREVTFSTPPGIVRQASIELSMSTTPGVAIYYTTDGSEPGRKSKRYEGAIKLSQNTCVRAVALGDDVLSSKPVVASFIFGSHNMRLVSIIGDPSQLTGSGGVLKTGKKRKSGTVVFAEIYEPDGTKLISQECTLKMVGHHSRTHYKQKSFKITAKRANGDTRFRAALFSNRDYDEVKAVVLRASGQDVMQTHMRDSILTSLAADTTVFYQETELCVVYINGQYWGEYNMREHVDEHSIAQFEGWQNPDGVVIAEGDTNNTRYNDMLKWVANHDLTSDSNVKALRSMIDIENYLDYVILEMFTCNQDLNNVRRYCSPEEDPRWKWVIFDLDLSFQVERNNVKDWMNSKVGTITSQSGSPFRYLIRNAKVKDYFLTRFGQLLATTLSTENIVGKIEARRALLADEIERTCARWKWDVSTWKAYTDRMVSYATKRPAKMIGYLTSTFSLSESQQQKYFGEAMAKAAAYN